MDVQRARFEPGEQRDGPAGARPRVDPAAVGAALEDLERAERPLLLVGGGVRASGSVDQLRAVAGTLGVPAVHSLMGVDALPFEHPLRVGMIGTYGNRWANIALAEADCLLVLGSRLDIRQTGADTDAFKGDRPIHHVDCEPGEINNRLAGCVGVEADLRDFLACAAEAALPHPGLVRWRERIGDLRRAWPDTGELRNTAGINPNRLMHRLSRGGGGGAAYVSDVGQHQMWAAQSLELDADQRFLTSGGMGAMGSGLPLAIGAAHAAAGRPVVLVAGDGSFQLNIQELETVVCGSLPLKAVVLDNGCHGMVRQFQETYFEGRYQSTEWGYSAPDFAAVAAAYGISSASVDDPRALDHALAELWADPHEPYLLHVAIDPRANAYPKIAFGHPISEMEPFARPAPMGSPQPS
jgi:acetolactate synthase-1/2/3 large subunit